MSTRSAIIKRHAPLRARRGSRQMRERPVQRGAIDLILQLGFQPYHVPNGVALGGDRIARAKQMSVLKADGLRVGFPDLGILGPGGRTGFIEVKGPDGSEADLSPDQVWWRDWLLANGHLWGLICKPEDVLEVFRAWRWR